AALLLVEVEPVFVVHIFTRHAPARRMIGDEMRAAIAGLQARGQRAPDGAMPVVFHGAIAAENPDDRLIAIALPQPLAVDPRVFRREDLRTLAPLLVHLI